MLLFNELVVTWTNSSILGSVESESMFLGGIYMAVEGTHNKALFRRVLNCIGERWETLEEIRERYNKLYPPSFAVRLLGVKETISIRNLRLTLIDLWREELVLKEVTSFTDRPLKKQTPVYRISNKGRAQKK